MPHESCHELHSSLPVSVVVSTLLRSTRKDRTRRLCRATVASVNNGETMRLEKGGKRVMQIWCKRLTRGGEGNTYSSHQIDPHQATIAQEGRATHDANTHVNNRALISAYSTHVFKSITVYVAASSLQIWLVVCPVPGERAKRRREGGSKKTKDAPLTGPSISTRQQLLQLHLLVLLSTVVPSKLKDKKKKKKKRGGGRAGRGEGGRQTKDTPLASSSISSFIYRQVDQCAWAGWLQRVWKIDVDEYRVEVAVEVDVGETVFA